jgi:hypothetical protein
LLTPLHHWQWAFLNLPMRLISIVAMVVYLLRDRFVPGLEGRARRGAQKIKEN